MGVREKQSINSVSTVSGAEVQREIGVLEEGRDVGFPDTKLGVGCVDEDVFWLLMIRQT